MFQECHIELTDRLLSMTQFSRTHHRMDLRVLMVRVQDPRNKPGDMEHRPTTRMVTIQVFHKDGHQDHIQDNPEVRNFANHPSTVDHTEDTSGFLPHLQDLLFRLPLPTRDQTEQISSSSTFLTISLIWTCTNFFAPMGIF